MRSRGCRRHRRRRRCRPARSRYCPRAGPPSSERGRRRRRRARPRRAAPAMPLPIIRKSGLQIFALSYHPCFSTSAAAAAATTQFTSQPPVRRASAHARARCSTPRRRARKRRFIVSNPTVWRLHERRVRRRHRRRPILMPDGERHKNLQTVGRDLRRADPRARRSRQRDRRRRRRRGRRHRRLCRGDVPARRPRRPGADDAAGAGRQRDRRQGRRQPCAGQEPDRRVSSAGAGASSIRRCSSTLPRREFRAGLYEVIKYGVIASRPLFERVAAAAAGAVQARPRRADGRSSPSRAASRRESSSRTSARRACGGR